MKESLFRLCLQQSKKLITISLTIGSCSQLFISYFELIFLSDKIKKRKYSLCYIEDFL